MLHGDVVILDSFAGFLPVGADALFKFAAASTRHCLA